MLLKGRYLGGKLLTLHRRRSRLPWIYLVYHAAEAHSVWPRARQPRAGFHSADRLRIRP